MRVAGFVRAIEQVPDVDRSVDLGEVEDGGASGGPMTCREPLRSVPLDDRTNLQLVATSIHTSKSRNINLI